MNDGSEDVFRIYQRRAQVPAHLADSVMVIDEFVETISESDANRMYGTLLACEADHDFPVPVVKIVAQHIWRMTANNIHDDGPYTMDILFIFGRELKRRLDEEPVDRIECAGLETNFRRVVEDVSDAEGIDVLVTGTQSPTVGGTARELAYHILMAAVVLLDLVLSRALRGLFATKSSDYCVVYPLGRPDTFRPLESSISVDYDVMVLVRTHTYLRRFTGTIGPSSRVRPINTGTTVPIILAEFVLVVRLFVALYVGSKVQGSLARDVERRTGLHLPSVVSVLLRRAILHNLDGILRYRTARRLFESDRYESILLPNTAPSAKGVIYPAIEAGVRVARLPHTITNQYSRFDNQYPHTLFLEGTIGSRYLEDVSEVDPVVSGHPKLLFARERRDTLTRDTTETGTIVLATQTFKPVMRDEFVRRLVPTLLDHSDFDVVIKIHPGEDAAFYRSVLAELGLDGTERDRVIVKEDALYETVYNAGLLITTNSTVGIESIILGTPTVCFNPWTPNVRSPLYALEGSVPQLSSAEELLPYLAPSRLELLVDVETSLLTDGYLVEGLTMEDIARTIEASLVGEQL